MKKTLVYWFIGLLVYWFIAPVVFAQSPTLSASPTPAVSPTPLSGVNGTLSVPTPAKEIIESAQKD